MMFDENDSPQKAPKTSTAAVKGKSNTASGTNATQKKAAGGGGASRSIEEMYQKKSQLEHILLRPDTYIGSVEKHSAQMWVLEPATNQLVNRQVTYVPGLYKIFDEIIVNAADNKQRDPSMNRIDVTIDASSNLIRVWNNGNGIPIAIHQEHQIYVPELIFGHLLTGSNFDDEEQKTTGGRNGYGAKLANIFSTEFIVETVDSSRGLKFKQVFRDNMGTRSAPEVTKYSGTDYTCISFKPDIARFKMDCLDEDIVALLSKRVYDIAATNTASGAKLGVSLNGQRIDIRNFEQYIQAYKGLEAPVAFERVNERWEVGVGISDGSFQQVSYVNSICTIKGGQHVNYIVDQVAARLMAVVKKKNKGEEVKAAHIKNHLAIYVNALIVNPAFDSQTKETLTTKASAFGSTCPLSEKMLKKIETSGIVDNILSWAKFKQNAELKKKGGTKRSKLFGITKLDDANFAGTAKSKDCTLILTEGDSAKALAISGLGVVGRDYYGVFPLRGKLLNVREAAHAQIMKNEEIQNIAQILGLTFGREYEDASSLRYGHLMIMTDQDHDGSHIKGLLINFLHHFWPSLLRIDGFLQQFITPIVKCSKGKKEVTFFTIPEYKEWREATNDGHGWKIKYYKGLGTSTAAEAKEYFSNLQTHELDFAWCDNAGDAIDMAFAKKRVDDRKNWLLAMDPKIHIDYSVDKVTYGNFINHELILFSHADNARSIPCFLDGFKPSQRKVLFSCFKRNLKNEIKVVQLAGYVSEHSAYHHGEVSLTQTIIGMAQNFVGSNNVNLLSPCGQFGTRLMSGKDAASARYVFTKLEAITRCIFHPDDDALLTYLDDDGESIEPEYYVPVIPTVLVNGSEGIGTGWSSSVPTFNPRDIINALRYMIANDGVLDTESFDIRPWYRGFTGEVRAKTGRETGSYSIIGTIEQVDDSTVVITELPVGRATTDYKQFLESVLIGNPAATTTAAASADGAPSCPAFIKDFKENHTDTTVLFTVTVPPEKLAEINADKGGLIKKFKLESSVSTTNMHLFDENGVITKYDSVNTILAAFFDIRSSFYQKRKIQLVAKLTEEWDKLDNKVRFILAVINNEIVVSNRRKQDLIAELKQLRFRSFKTASKKNNSSSTSNEEEAEGASQEDTESGDDDKGDYDYLLSMKLWNLTHEKVVSLTAERDAKRRELDELVRRAPQDLWLADLDALEVALDDYEEQFEEAKRQESAARKKANKAASNKRINGKAAKASKPKKNRYGSDSEDDGMSDSDDAVSDFESDYDEAPKKKAAPKPRAVAAPATKPVASTTAPKPMAVTKPTATSTAAAAPKPAVVSVVEPAPAATLSLAQRLLARMDIGNTAAAHTATVSAPAVTAPKATAAAKAAPVAKKHQILDDDEEFECAPKPRATRPAAAASKKKKTIMSDSEEEDMDEEDNFSFQDDSESDFEDEKPKKGAKKRPVKAAPAKETASAAAAPKAAAAKKPAAKKAEKAVVDLYSPDAGVSPRTTKKARSGAGGDNLVSHFTINPVSSPLAAKVKPLTLNKKAATSTASAPAVKAPAAAPKAKAAAATTSKAAAPKKASAASAAPAAKKKTARRIVSSDDEEEEDAFSGSEDSDAAVPARRASPKAARARKPTNYAQYYQEEEEDSEAQFDEDDDDSYCSDE